MKYAARLTPTSVAGVSPWLTMEIMIPVQSGENISVVAQASRSADTPDCADCVIDPEGAWFTPTTVAWDLTNTATYYALPACTASTAGGTNAHGMVRVVFHMKEYTAAAYLDIGAVYITCGGITYPVTMERWQNGMPSIGKPIMGGTTEGEVTLSKETGAAARGGSGTCAKLLPLSTTAYGYWDFYVPVTAATAFTMSFWYWCTSGFNGQIKVTTYDTDQVAVLDASRDVGETADGDWHQYAGFEVTPTATGLCRVRVEVLQGAHSAADVIYIDDIAVA